MHSFSHAWRALRFRNFQLFFVGQGTSVIGSWMTRLATSWLVFRLTHSELLLGVIGFVSQIIPFLLGPIAGVWVERWDRRQLLVWTQAAAAVQSLSMAALTLTHAITLWEIIALQRSRALSMPSILPRGTLFWCRWLTTARPSATPSR